MTPSADTVATSSARRDVIVIGGGPAGLTAALALARGGLSVTVVDEQPELGGQYHRRSGAGVVSSHPPRSDGTRLIGEVRNAGVECLTGSTIWGVADDGRTLFRAPSDGIPDGGPDMLTGRYTVVATGAYERVFPFPGWELPGVTTIGLAQHLATDGVPLGRSVLVAGSGPFLLPVACSLLEVGAHVVGIAEAGNPYRPGRAGFGALRFPARLGELASYLARLARHRVPLWQNRVVSSVDADGTGERPAWVHTAPADRLDRPDRTHAVDAVCVGYGFRPQVELAEVLGCRMRTDPWSGDQIPVLDGDGRSSRPDVFIIGETAGPAGVHAARERAVAASAAILGGEGASPGARRSSTRPAERFRLLTERLYPAPVQLGRQLAAALPDSVHVCRCEAVTAGAVRSAPPGRDLSVVKISTRAGMGICQGRECASTLAFLTHAAAPGETTAGAPSTVQCPVRPIPLSAVLRAAPAAGARR